jgi:hypothetical protein
MAILFIKVPLLRPWDETVAEAEILSYAPAGGYGMLMQ